MGIKAAIKSYLGGLAPLTALVGTRIYPRKKPQGAIYPQITYWRVSEPKRYSLDAAAGTVTARYQFTVWAKKETGTEAQAEAVLEKLAGPGGALDGTTGTWGSTRVQCCRIPDQEDGLEPPIYGDDGGIYWVSVDALITYDE